MKEWFRDGLYSSLMTRIEEVYNQEAVSYRKDTFMNLNAGDIPDVNDDPVIRLLLGGKAQTVDEAEELYLDGSLPELLELLRGSWSEAELARHPLITLLLARGSRGWEDSVL